MSDRSAASRYAKALFELAREAKIDAEVEAALVEFSKALKASPETERLLGDPRLGQTEKRRMFSRAFEGLGGPEAALLLDFLSVLFEKGRFGLFHDVASSYKAAADEAQGEATALVRTAQALDASDEARLVSILEKRTGDKIVVKKKVDPSVLGGVEVRIGHRVLDGTLRGALDRMKEQLLKR